MCRPIYGRKRSRFIIGHGSCGRDLLNVSVPFIAIARDISLDPPIADVGNTPETQGDDAQQSPPRKRRRIEEDTGSEESEESEEEAAEETSSAKPWVGRGKVRSMTFIFKVTQVNINTFSFLINRTVASHAGV